VIEGADAIAGGATQLLALVGLPLAIVLYYGTPYLAANGPTPPIPGEAKRLQNPMRLGRDGNDG